MCNLKISFSFFSVPNIYFVFITLKNVHFSHDLFSGKLKVCMFLEKIEVYDLVYHAFMQQNSFCEVKMIKE